jgi:selenocysteine lyase/cysteine desulfurase
MQTEGSHPDLRNLLEQSIFEALRTYSNVHRGSGHKSIASTALFEEARRIVLDYLGLHKRKYRVVFCTPYQAEILKKQLPAGTYRLLSSASLDLAIGVRAIAVKTSAFPRGAPPYSGGGTAKLISTEWAIWAGPPAKFEAGTPPVINIITFARALQLSRKYGEDIIRTTVVQEKNSQVVSDKDPLEGLKGIALLDAFRKTRIGLDLQVPTTQGNQHFINLDSSASTPAFGSVWDTFRSCLYANEQDRDRILDKVRKTCADFLGAPDSDYEMLFTGNTTEGINLVAGSMARADEKDDEPVILGTLLEHSSNELPWRTVPGHTLIRLPIDKEGFIDHQNLNQVLEDYNKKRKYGKKRIRLVAISAASNVLGTCNKLEEISEIVHHYDARLLVDGAQLVAHRKADIAAKGYDYFVFSAHKVYAPFGSGALVARKGLLNFTAQERDDIRAAGEENLAGISALGKVFEILGRIGMDLIEKEEQELTAFTLGEMQKIRGIKLVGIQEYDAPRLAQRVGVIPFNLGNMVSFSLGKKLALNYGIGVRVGCHCAHILVKHVLGVGPGLERFQRIMQTLIPAMSFPGVVRVSLGIENKKEDLDAFLSALRQISTGDMKHAVNSSRKERKQIFSDYSDAFSQKVFAYVHTKKN